MLVKFLADDEKAPLYVIRIWAHCQIRRATKFESMPCDGLRALCRYDGDAEVLEHGLINAGFIQRDGEAIIVPKWSEHNAKLIANWNNGATGGRPPNPNKTQTEPSSNPTVTHANPTVSDKIREDINTISGKPFLEPILTHLNEKAGRNYQPVAANLNLIAARLKEGFTPEQCQAVIDSKVNEWLDDSNMSKFLRPLTLFNATKFAQYVGELGEPTKEKDWI